MRLVASEIHVRYPSAGRDALSGASVEVAGGELVAVVGPSGSGKSTLMLVLAALLKPDAGSVAADGCDVWADDVVGFRRRLGVVFQLPESQLFGATVFEEVAFGPRQQGFQECEVERRVTRALDEVGLEAAMTTRNPFLLSGGEKRRVALASALAMEPEIMLFDEPAVGLDAAGRESLVGLVRSLVDAGRGALVVSHDAALVLPVADRVYVLQDGCVRWEGPATALRLRPGLARELGLDAPVEDVVAAALRERGVAVPDGRRWTAETLASAVASAVGRAGP